MFAEWRWKSAKRIRVNRRVSVGLPDVQREALETGKAFSGLSMSEIVRRALAEALTKKATRRRSAA